MKKSVFCFLLILCCGQGLSAASLSFNPGAFPFSGKVEITANVPAGGSFSDVSLDQSLLATLWYENTFIFDTAKYPDGLHILTLSYIMPEKVEREQYFITIKNNAEEIQAKPEPANQFLAPFLSLFETIASDSEKNQFSQDVYKANKENLKTIVFSQSFPYPDIHYRSLVSLAKLCYRTMDYPLAEEAAKKLSAQYPGKLTLEDLLLYCDIAEMGGRKDTLRDGYRRLKTKINELKNPQNTLLLGRCEMNLNNKEKAKEIFTTLLTQSEDPNVKIWAKFYLAVLQFESGDFDKALPVFESLSRKKRDDRLDEYALFYVAESYAGLQNWKEAIQGYHRVGFTLAPINKGPEALYKTAIAYYKLDDYKQVETPCNWLIQYHPKHPLAGEAKCLAVDALLAQNQKENWGIDPEERLNHLLFIIEDIIKQYPNTPLSNKAYYTRAEAIRNVADVYHEREDHVRARTIYAKLVGYEAVGMREAGKEGEGGRQTDLLEREPNPIVRNYLKTAENLYVNHSYQDAINVYRRILQESPNSPYAPYAQRSIGICYAGMKEYSTAVEELQKVVTKYPESSWASDALERTGMYYWQGLQDLDNAIKSFELLIKTYPENSLCSHAYFSLAQIYTTKEDYRKAKANYQLLIQKYPDSELAQRAANDKLAEVSKKEKNKKTGQANPIQPYGKK